MQEYNFVRPKNLAELFSTLGSVKGRSVFIAGGTDYVPRLNIERDRIPYEDKEPLTLVYLGGLGLDTVKDTGKSLLIGAGVTLSALLAQPGVKAKFPALYQALEKMAGVSVRNTGTIGGNIMNASPAADSVPALVVLGAVFTLVSKGGTRDIPAAEFFTGPGKTVAKPGELLTSITIPYGKGASAFQKIGRRQAETLSVANAAAYVEVQNGSFGTVRLALGSVGPTVVISKAAAALAGKPVSEGSIKVACEGVANEVTPIDDVRSTAWYRKSIAPVIAARAIMAAAGLGNGGV
jgi:carbon-monoxide dehydrogenase medium subunit